MRWKCAWTYFKANCPILNTYYKVCGVCCGGSQNLWGCPYSPSPTIIYLQFVQQWYPITQAYVICRLGFFFCVRYFYLISVLQSYFFFFHFLFPNIFCSSTSDLISSPAGLDLNPKRRRSRHQAWRAPYSHGGCRQPGETSFGIQLSQPDWELWNRKETDIGVIWYLGLNIAKGTTDPRVEFILPKSYCKFKHKSWSNFIFRILTQH